MYSLQEYSVKEAIENCTEQ